MRWLTDLLKHLAISQSVTGAVFLTALALLLGPTLIPSFVAPVPKEWSPLVVGALVFSGSLLIFWGVSAIWKLLARGAKAASEAVVSARLHPREQEVLLALGGNPSTPLNLDNVDYERAPFTKLEMIELVHSLEKKGLVRTNPYDDSLVTLTPSGRKRTLELQRQWHA